MKTYFELINEMGKSDLQELESRLAVLIEHLLKITHATGQVAHDNFRGWSQTVRNQRRDVAAHIRDIRDNRGLKSKLTKQMLDRAYRIALAKVKTEYRTMPFPATRQLSLDEIVGHGFGASERPGSGDGVGGENHRDLKSRRIPKPRLQL